MPENEPVPVMSHEDVLHAAIGDYLTAKLGENQQFDRNAPNIQAVIQAILKIVMDFASNPTAIIGDVIALFTVFFPFPPNPPTPIPKPAIPGGIPGLGSH